MRIDSAQLQLSGQHHATTRHTREEQLTLRLPNRSGEMRELSWQHREVTERHQLMTYDAIQQQSRQVGLQPKADALGADVNQHNRSLQALTNMTTSSEVGVTATDQTELFLPLSAEDKLRIELIKSLVASLTGKELKFDIIDLRYDKASASGLPAGLTTSTESQPPLPPEAASLEYQVKETFYQRETSQFEALGRIKTRDGQEIDIQISLTMHRELSQQQAFSMRLGAALQDPLVISFDGRAAELSQQRFEFDLTLDGQKEWIPGLANHAAFLALDRNGDGIINDGRELFGAVTGDGFKELAEFDHDGNGWIDEADPVFEHLKLWFKPGSGDSQQLISLKEAGIGAIYLGTANTPFSLTSSLGDERLGVIRSTGIYVSEQGKAGIIQHVDLSI